MTTKLSIAPNVTLRAMQTDKFKTGCFSVNFLRQHERSAAAADALLPSVLLRGCERYPDIADLSTRLDELYGAGLGVLVRRRGEAKLTGFYADFIEEDFLPDGEAVFAPMVALLEEVLYRPLTSGGCFRADYVEGEKRNLINAIEASLNEKRSYAMMQMLRHMCADEPYGVPRLGLAQDVAALTPQALWEHYRSVLSGSRIELFYAGRQTPQAAAERFAGVFAPRAPQCAQTPVTKLVRQADAVRSFGERLDVTQGKLVLGLRTGITLEDAQFPALLLLNAVYGAGPMCKLYVNVREKLSLCYYASSSIDKYKGLMTVSTGVAFEDRERAQEAILAELEACRRVEISEAELSSAKRQTLSALRALMDAPAQLDDFYIGDAVASGEDIPALMEHVSALTVDALAAAARRLSLDTVYFLEGVKA